MAILKPCAFRRRRTSQGSAASAEQVRRRVLRWFARRGLIDSNNVREMLTWENGGFSLDAEVQIALRDRARNLSSLAVSTLKPCKIS
jgi:hypothetical protein